MRQFSKTSVQNRITFLIACLISGYSIVKFPLFNTITTIYLTLSFGTILLSCLFLFIFGTDILKNSFVVIVASLIPLGFSLGLVSHFFINFHFNYLIFSCVGIVLLMFTRFFVKGKIATIVLALVHGTAGILIFILPFLIYFQNKVTVIFILISIGGTLIGVSGLLLAFLKIGKPILKETMILKILPSVLLLMTLFFSLGLLGIVK